MYDNHRIHFVVKGNGAIQQFCTRKYLKSSYHIKRTSSRWKNVTCGACLRMGNKTDQIDIWK